VSQAPLKPDQPTVQPGGQRSNVKGTAGRGRRWGITVHLLLGTKTRSSDRMSLEWQCWCCYLVLIICL